MSFYGNITNTSRAPFTFDRIYSSRSQMEKACTSDGIYAGRYVLIEYDKQFSHEKIVRVYRKDEDSDSISGIPLYKDLNCTIPIANMTKSEDELGIGEVVVVREASEEKTQQYLTNDEVNQIRNFYNDGELFEGDYFCDFAETINEEVVLTRIYFDESALVILGITPSTTQTTDSASNQIMQEKELLFSYWRCDSLPTEETPYNLFTNISYSNVKNEAGSLYNYLTNANLDFGEYSGTFDSTVWEKIYIGENEQYIRIANLNSRFPTLMLTADAPSENPIPPHFNPTGDGEVYNLHIQSQWGLRVAAADGALSTHGMVQDEDGNYITKRNYLEDQLLAAIDEIITSTEEDKIKTIVSKYEDLLKEKVYSKINLSEFERAISESSSLEDDKIGIAEKYAIELLKNSYKSDENIVWSNSNNSGEYTAAQDENGELVWIAGENSTYPGAIYYNKAGFDSKQRSRADDETDYITLESTGFSQVYDENEGNWINQPYNDEDNVVVGSTESAPDTKEVRINLPSVGNAISDVWDLTYGQERNQNIEWESTEGLRMVTPREGNKNTGYNYEKAAVSTIAGCINSVQDLMGKIIVEIEDLEQDNVINLSYDNIYYSKADGKFYYKEDAIDFSADYSGKIIETEEDYKNKVQGYTEVSLTDKKNIGENYFYKEGADYVYKQNGDSDKQYYKIEAQSSTISVNENYYKKVDDSFRKIRDGEGFSNGDKFVNISDSNFDNNYYAYIKGKFFIKTIENGRTVYKKSKDSFDATKDYLLLYVDNASTVEIEGEDTITAGTINELTVYNGSKLVLQTSVEAYDKDATYYYINNLKNHCPIPIKPTEEEYVKYIEEKTVYYLNGNASQIKMLNPEVDDVYIASNQKNNISTYSYNITTDSDINLDNDSGFFKIKKLTDSSRYYEDYSESAIFSKPNIKLDELEKIDIDFSSFYKLIENENIKKYQKINNDVSIENNTELYTLVATLINLNFYEPEVYFIKDANGYYSLCTDAEFDSNKTYYSSSKGKYIVTNSYGGYSQGQIWDNSINWDGSVKVETKTVIDSLTSASVITSCNLVSEQDLVLQQKVKELIGFAQNYNTIHGLILRLNKILRAGDLTTRDISTVQGALNRLNDEIGRIGSYNLTTLQAINDKINSFKDEIKELEQKVEEAKNVLDELKKLLGDNLKIDDILTVENYKEKLSDFYKINETNYNPYQIIDLLYNKIKNLEGFIQNQFNGQKGLSNYDISYNHMRAIADMMCKKYVPIYDLPGYGGVSSGDQRINLIQTYNKQAQNYGASTYDIVPYITTNKNHRKEKKNNIYRVSNITNKSFYVPLWNMLYIDLSWTDYPDYKNKGKSNVKNSNRVYQKAEQWIRFFKLNGVEVLKNQSLNLTINVQETANWLDGECFLHTDGTFRCRFATKYKAAQSLRVRGWVMTEPLVADQGKGIINPITFTDNNTKIQVSDAEKSRLDNLVNNYHTSDAFIPYQTE